MKNRTWLVCCMVVALAATVFANTDLSAQSADPKVEVVGFSVAKKDEKSKYGGSAAVGLTTGTKVYVKITMKDLSIVSVAEKEVPVIIDGSGKELNEKSPRFLSLKYAAQISEDKKSVTVPVSGKVVPSSNSQKMSLKGKFQINCGSTTKEETVTGELKTEGEFKLAGIESKIQRLEKGFKDNTTRVTFRAKTSFDAIKEIHAVDADGKKVAGRTAGSGSFGFRDKKTYDQSYEFELKQDQIKKFHVVYFDKIETIDVPVEVTFGFGF